MARKNDEVRKSVQDQKDKQLFLDYIEWCPKEIYDNPETPEDIW